MRASLRSDQWLIILHRVSEEQRPVGELDARLPAAIPQPECAAQEDILGTLLLAVLAGHKRYAHVTTVRSGSVLPELLGMKCVRSEDLVRGPFSRARRRNRIPAGRGSAWRPRTSPC